MKRYVEHPRGVIDRETGKLIRGKDPEWHAYVEWLKEFKEPDPYEPPVYPPPTVADVLNARIREVENRAAEERAKVTQGASPQEMASWSVKLDQAKKYAGDPLAVPMLKREADARGVTTVDIVNRVLANADAYSMAEAFICGVAGKHKDALRLLTTVEDLRAYDITTGWAEGQV